MSEAELPGSPGPPSLKTSQGPEGPRRLQRLIAGAGVASRRKAEELLVAGRVTVNGVVVRELGTRADLAVDRVEVDGRRLMPEEIVVLALHKPRGVVTSVSDPHATRTAIDLVAGDFEQRLYPAGRLDKDSEGLLIVTNDGELTHAITRPGGLLDKEYQVQVDRALSAAEIQQLSGGMLLGGQQLLPCSIRRCSRGGLQRPLALWTAVSPEAMSKSKAGAARNRELVVYRILLHEGKNRQIRRMFRACRRRVQRLVRVRIGPLRLGDLRSGCHCRISGSELATLRRSCGLPVHADGGQRRVGS